MKRWGLILFAAAFAFAACNHVEPDLPLHAPMMTDQTGGTLVNTGTIALGSVDTDVVFDMFSTILTPEGRYEEHTLNSCALAACALKDGAQDPDRPVTNVTLINKGTITVHTRDLVEKYKDQIQDPDHPDRKFKYLRFIGLYAGNNCTLINDGVINVYFDHDPAVAATIYMIGMVAGDGSNIVNNGEINFHGEGTMATRMRGVATFANNISIQNHGVISADVKVSDDSRGITTGGTASEVYNDGTISMRLAGTIFCITRYGDTKITNAGTIEVTSTSYPEDKLASTAGTTKLVCALYDPLTPTRTGMPPMINKGIIRVNLDDSAPSDPERAVFGMLMDMQSPAAEKLNVKIVNEGSIYVNNPGGYDMAEAGFWGKPATVTGAATITMGTWKTRLRDFSQTRDLFLAKGVNMDFSQGSLLLEADSKYSYGTSYSIAPEAIMFDAGAGTYRYEHSGYEQMTVASADPALTLLWDRDNKTAALKK
ncbi:MAG: hypothetical protein IK031_06860 [Bacteroidales bacterium]|nr:hypothetical protein [Bacteroidales bacterium]